MQILDLYLKVHILSEIISTYAIYLLVGCFFTKKKVSTKGIFAVYIIYYVIICLLEVLAPIPIVMLTANIILLFVLTNFYEGTIKKRLVSTLYIYTSLKLIEILVEFMTGYNSQYSAICVLLGSHILTFIATIVFRDLKHFKNNTAIPFSQWLATVLMPLCSFFLLILLFRSENASLNTILFSIIITLILNITAFYIYNNLVKIYNTKLKEALLLQQNAFLDKQLNLMKNSISKTKSVMHDYKNHLMAISRYLERNNSIGALQYLSDLDKALVDSKNKDISKSGNINIDSILNYKLNAAIEKGIFVTLNIKIPSELPVTSFDINVILSNLIDNAVEAVSKLKEDKFININLSYCIGILNLSIENSFNGQVTMKQSCIISSKKDQFYHGIGLKNVTRTVKKYSGDIDINFQDDLFKVNVLLYLNEGNANE